MTNGQAPWRVVLIVEDDSDGKAVRALVAPLNVQGVIDWLPANGIGNILRDCRRLIDLARDRIQAHGCVAVVIDGDSRSVARDEPHRTIARECRRSRVPLIVIREALEAWMLADPGICQWLAIPTRSTTHTLRDPKDLVSRAFLRKTGRPYRRRRARLEVAQHATGVTRTANPSFHEAVGHLEECGILGAHA